MFRVGDAVVTRCDQCEGRVVEIRDDGDIRIHTRNGFWGPGALTLLRRPVHVGDSIRFADGASYPMTAEADVIHRYLPPRWVHADGTPIDPPANAPAPVSQGLTFDEVKDRYERFVVETAAKVVRAAEEIRTEENSDVVSGKVHRVLQQRANQLGDECGRLADENRSLLVENATLRRQVERLERKAKR